MKLPFTVLQSLAAAVACLGVSGCGYTTASSSGAQQRPSEPNTIETGAPGEQPGKVCLPDNCPACGRG